MAVALGTFLSWYKPNKLTVIGTIITALLFIYSVSLRSEKETSVDSLLYLRMNLLHSS